MTSEVLARDYVWFTISDFQVLPKATRDDELGAVIEQHLRRAMALDPDVGTPTTERKKIHAAQYKAVGARGMRDVARDNDAVNFTWNDQEGLIVTPLVALDNGGFGAWGGDVTIGAIPAAEELGRLCREGWERGGVPQPEGSEPSHT